MKLRKISDVNYNVSSVSQVHIRPLYSIYIQMTVADPFWISLFLNRLTPSPLIPEVFNVEDSCSQSRCNELALSKPLCFSNRLLKLNVYLSRQSLTVFFPVDAVFFRDIWGLSSAEGSSFSLRFKNWLSSLELNKSSRYEVSSYYLASAINSMCTSSMEEFETESLSSLSSLSDIKYRNILSSLAMLLLFVRWIRVLSMFWLEGVSSDCCSD